MIYINKHTSNQVILRLSGVSSLLSPIYLFEFINNMNPSNITYFTAEDLSSYRCGYNRFNIIEDDTSIPLSGQVSLRSGSYTYNIYEGTGATLSVSATTGAIINTGKVRVVGLDTQLADVYK